MQQFQLPDPFAPLLAGLSALTQSLQQQQEQQHKMMQEMRQAFTMHQHQLESAIEDAVGVNDAMREIIKYSEDEGVEVSGVLFYDPDSEQVSDLFVDSVGDLTSVDLDLVKIPSDPDLEPWSFHSHPRFGILDFSRADIEVASTRVWEGGHCVVTKQNGVVANCLEIEELQRL